LVASGVGAYALPTASQGWRRTASSPNFWQSASTERIDPADFYNKIGPDLPLLLMDCADLLDVALKLLVRGSQFPGAAAAHAAADVAAMVVRHCRAAGNVGQLERCSHSCQSFVEAWRGFEADFKASEAARSVPPPPKLGDAARAEKDEELTHALKESFPASDPIAVSDD